jgi:hypothetical protein
MPAGLLLGGFKQAGAKKLEEMVLTFRYVRYQFKI